jgi:hypothetical protein
MGILDEAIKEHLDLKRRQGAADDEIARLEDEAFGPPSRPGDPDFPEQDAAPEQGTAEADQVAVEAEAPSEEMTAEPEYAEEAPSEEAPVAEAQAETTPEAQPQTEEGDRAGFYDAEAEEAEEDLDLDLELDIDSELENVGDLDVDEGPASPSGEDAPPISQLDTVEHHFEEAIDEAEVVEDQPPADQSGSAEPEAGAEAGAGEEGGEHEEDVLEETPEFLQDAPEDDELWFEQGEPKDFDF